jgi:hypothetical protein
MPRWTTDEKTGKDVAYVNARIPLDRAQFATLRAYQRDNEGLDLKSAVIAVFFVGLDELSSDYDPRRKQKPRA